MSCFFTIYKKHEPKASHRRSYTGKMGEKKEVNMKMLKHPLTIVCLIYTTILTCIILQFIHRYDAFNYAIDDPYIHLTIAKNLAFNHYWGVSDHQFSSASSSPFWTLLLTGLFLIFGDNELIPLVLNIIFSFLSIYVIYLLLKKYNFNRIMMVTLLLLIIGNAQIVTITLVGMEHILQLFFLLVFFYLIQKYERITTEPLIWLSIIGFLAVWSRYESAFFIFAICVYWLFKNQIKAAFTIGIFSLLPVVIMGAYFLSQNGTFLPYTLLIKGNWEWGNEDRVIWILTTYVKQTSIVLIGIILYWLVGKKVHNPVTTRLLYIWLVFSVTHVFFFGFGAYHYRYIMFFVVFKFIVYVDIFRHVRSFIPKEKEKITKKMYGFTLAFLMIFTIAVWGKEIYMDVHMMKDIRNQQIQMKNFIFNYYNDKTVALNDIGIISYRTNIKLVDLWGLGTKSVALWKKEHAYNTDKIRTLVNQKRSDAIIVYTNWYDAYGGVPKEWIKVADWKYANVIVTGKKVTFYARNKRDAEKMRIYMKEFQPKIPDEVNVKIY